MRILLACYSKKYLVEHCMMIFYLQYHSFLPLIVSRDIMKVVRFVSITIYTDNPTNPCNLVNPNKVPQSWNQYTTLSFVCQHEKNWISISCDLLVYILWHLGPIKDIEVGHIWPLSLYYHHLVIFGWTCRVVYLNHWKLKQN